MALQMLLGSPTSRMAGKQLPPLDSELHCFQTWRLNCVITTNRHDISFFEFHSSSACVTHRAPPGFLRGSLLCPDLLEQGSSEKEKAFSAIFIFWSRKVRANLFISPHAPIPTQPVSQSLSELSAGPALRNFASCIWKSFSYPTNFQQLFLNFTHLPSDHAISLPH